MHEYNIAGTKLHENDHRSVSLGFESMRDQANGDSNNPILVFKQQSHEQSHGYYPTEKMQLQFNKFILK